MVGTDPGTNQPVVVTASQTTEVTEKKSTTVKQRLFGRFAESFDPAVMIGLLVFVLITVALWSAFGRGSSLLTRLQEQAYARGLITYIFTVGTLGIAFTLVGSALFGNASDESFRRAREVFSVLAGVLGTIVGFYFGSTGPEASKPTVGSIRIVVAAGALQLTAYVSGGTAPFQYDIDVDDKSFKRDLPSKDGWIVESLGSEVTKLTGELRVRDSKGQSVETKFTYPTDAPLPTPSPSPTRTPTPTLTPLTTQPAAP